MAGNWALAFRRTNFGSPDPQPYTITLTRLDDSKCLTTAPCWGGPWWNPGANRYEGFANISVVPDGAGLDFSDIEQPDNSQRGKQYYQAAGANDSTKPMSFTGTFRQDASDLPTTDGSHTLKATFTLTQTS